MRSWFKIQNLRIKDIPINDRPIERLINSGSAALSNEELLAILIKTGTKDMSAKALASLLLSKTNGLKETEKLNYEYLRKIKGIGPSKAAVIMASLELGRRINQTVDNLTNTKFNNSSVVYEYYRNILGNKKQEHFYVIYLDSSKKIIKDKLLFMGTLNQSLVHPREVFKEACLLSASSFICVHNHPSGNVLPSKEDIALTDNLKQIGLLFGIPIVDHIIISKENYYSFFENGDI